MHTEIQHKIKYFCPKKSTRGVCKSMIISITLLLSIIIFLFWSFHPLCPNSAMVLYESNQHTIPYPHLQSSPTNVSHIAFAIVGSVNTWLGRRHYIESWWKPNVTRGFLHLDRSLVELLPWPPTSPPVHVYNNQTRMSPKDKTLHALRVVEAIRETFRVENQGVRWFVVGDDDTLVLTENLVEVLRKYDHNRYYYIGTNSECVFSNSVFSYNMAFGGAGVALSYPLAEALVKSFDVCLKRSQILNWGDPFVHSCVTDLGVSLTLEKGFHQIDLHGDISGLLSSHPQTPLVTLHHLDLVDPIFPAMDRRQAVAHLMSAAAADESRLLQQSVCHHHRLNWTFSLSWGYALHIYERPVPATLLKLPLQTFIEWRKGFKPPFVFNTRPALAGDPCEAPHVFYFDSVEERSRRRLVTAYVRRSPRGLPACAVSGNHSAEYVEKIRVISPVTRLETEGGRRECCDIIRLDSTNVTTIKVRSCMKDEILG